MKIPLFPEGFYMSLLLMKTHNSCTVLQGTKKTGKTYNIKKSTHTRKTLPFFLECKINFYTIRMDQHKR